jgi:hypothetical protein
MRPVNKLIKDSLQIYTDNWVFLTKALLISVALVLPLILGFIPPAAAAIGAIFAKQKVLMIFLAIIFFLVFIILSVIIGSWSQTLVYQAVYQAGKGKLLSIKEVLRLAWKKWPAYFLATLLSTFLIILGFILLIVPGIILVVWFFFIPYVVVIEKTGAVQALKRSKKLVEGHFWGVLGRLALIFLISIFVGSILVKIGLIGPIANFLLSPFWMVVGYLIYVDLAKAKRT